MTSDERDLCPATAVSDAGAPGAFYEVTQPAVILRAVAVTHSAVCSEALRWSTGQRGQSIAATAMEGIDLTAFVTQALVVGAQSIAMAGGVQDTFNLEQLVTDVGVRTAESSVRAAEATSAVTQNASEVIQPGCTDETSLSGGV